MCWFLSLVDGVDAVAGGGDDVNDWPVWRVDGTAVVRPWQLAGCGIVWRSFRRCPHDAACLDHCYPPNEQRQRTTTVNNDRGQGIEDRSKVCIGIR